jgi:hypothetical protein
MMLPPEETNKTKFANYVKFCSERHKQMGKKYKKIHMNNLKWNDPNHFDWKINVILSYKEGNLKRQNGLQKWMRMAMK